MGIISLSDFPEPEELPDAFVIIFDSSGVKVINRGEWLRKKYGKKARKGWIKLHVALDLKSKKVVELALSGGLVRRELENTKEEFIFKAGIMNMLMCAGVV